ncbi:hypothetical protein J3A83DRAFT_1662814 [Scleroderma citrinum]
MAESSQILRISRIELQNADKVESAQLTIGGSPHAVKRRDGNILSAEFSPALESTLQEPCHLSITKRKWHGLKSSETISLDPSEVLSKLKGRRKVTIVLEILTSTQPDTTTYDTMGAQPELPTPSIPGLLIPTTEELLKLCPRFRILIIGKTGVGKTSLINSTFGIDDAVE